MNPMQPYVQKNTEGYESIIARDPRIFQYYEFQERQNAKKVNAVPDGCVDLLYAIGESDVKCYLGGTVLKLKYWPFEENRTYFGVRFYPGQSILPKDVSIEDIINEDIELSIDCYGSNVDEQLYQAGNLKERAAVISQMLQNRREDSEQLNSKAEIESYIRRRIYETNGMVSIKQISEETGYSECYVRRTFHEMHGISPKIFEKIVRFQNALEEMNIHRDMALYDLAQESGYYDQSHMVKEFKNFMGLTPELYRKYMEND